MTKRKRPKLNLPKLTDDDLDRMAEITDQDIVAASAEWQEHADNSELLEAAPEDEDGDSS